MIGVLLLLGAAMASERLVLPPGEDTAQWSRALAETDLAPASEGRASIEVVDGAWLLVVVDRAGVSHRVRVDPPTTDEQRQDLAFLALSLLEPAGASTWRHTVAWDERPPPQDAAAPAKAAAPVVAVATASPGTDAVPTARRSGRPPPDYRFPEPPSPRLLPEPPFDLPLTEPLAPSLPESRAATPRAMPLQLRPQRANATRSRAAPWVALSGGMGWWTGWDERFQARLEAGIDLSDHWRVGAGAQVAGPMLLDSERKGTERGGALLLARRAVDPVWLSLGAALTERRFAQGGVEADRSWVPALEAGAFLEFPAPLGLSAAPALRLRRDLRALDVEVGSTIEQTLPAWDLQASMIISWRARRDRIASRAGT